MKLGRPTAFSAPHFVIVIPPHPPQRHRHQHQTAQRAEQHKHRFNILLQVFESRRYLRRRIIAILVPFKDRWNEGIEIVDDGEDAFEVSEMLEDHEEGHIWDEEDELIWGGVADVMLLMKLWKWWDLTFRQCCELPPGLDILKRPLP